MSLTERPYKQYPDLIVTIPAGESRDFARQGRKFMCISVTTDEAVKIGLDQEPVEWMYTQVGVEIGAGEQPFTRIYLKNESGAPQTVKIKTSMGDITDNRLVLVGGSIATTVTNWPGETADDVADVTIASGATHTIAANANRRALIVQNLSSLYNLRIGGNTPGASRGNRVAPEADAVIQCKGAIKVYNDGAGNVNISIMEILN